MSTGQGMKLHLHQCWNRFRSNEAGAIALTFGLVVLPLLLATGIAVDFIVASKQQAKLQSVVDAATLAGANPSHATLEERQAIVQQYLDANLNQVDIGQLGTPSVTVEDGAIKVELTTEYPTRFMRLAGYTKQSIGAASTVIIPFEKDAEVAFVLDYSGSMNSKGKYEAMRDAATNMIDILTKNGTETDRFKFGLVPFSHHVNLSLPGEYVVDEAAGTTWTNCTQDRKYPYNVQDSVPDSADVDTLWGMSPTNGYGVGAYSVCNPYVANNLVVKPLTDDAQVVKDQLAIMTPHNLTHIALGTEFGWALLSPTAPFTEGADYSDENVEKYLVILTDGVQTEKAWGSSKSHSVPNGETNLEEMCTNIKGTGITIITIAFDLNDTWTEDRLKNCATTPADFHIADDNEDLASVFEAIAYKLEEHIRIAR